MPKHDVETGFGGRYVPEMLIPALEDIHDSFAKYRNDAGFKRAVACLGREFTGRPSPLCLAEHLSRAAGSLIFLKLESHNHTGAHKINNVIGQALLAREMGKEELVAETGAGQHGVATAAVAAKLGMKCRVFMGEMDILRQYPNVYSMKLYGAEVVPVVYGSRTLKDAVNEAMKYWIENLNSSYYLIGSALGPDPYPDIVRHFQSVIGLETRVQLAEKGIEFPDAMVACVGGGSNALGFFHPFLDADGTELFGVEAGGVGPGPGENAVRFGGAGSPGVVQGYKSYFLQDSNGQILPTRSISAGLDYPGVSPDLAELHCRGRISFTAVSDGEALEAYRRLARAEGIIPALESAHAVAFALKLSYAGNHRSIVVNISGRGDKDMFITAPRLDGADWAAYLEREVLRGRS